MKVLIVALIALLIAQITKVIHEVIITKEIKWNYLWETGNFPSSHSAAMTALTLALYFEEGFSNLFILALVMLILIIRDAMGVRFSVGENSKKINELAKKVKIKGVKVTLGHKPLQVFAGMIIGILVSLLFYL